MKMHTGVVSVVVMLTNMVYSNLVVTYIAVSSCSCSTEEVSSID